MDLRPCPFCGGHPNTHTSASLDLGPGYDDGPGIGCIVCHYCICRNSLSEAAVAWNTRATTEATEELAALELALAEAEKREAVFREALRSLRKQLDLSDAEHNTHGQRFVNNCLVEEIDAALSSKPTGKVLVDVMDANERLDQLDRGIGLLEGLWKGDFDIATVQIDFDEVRDWLAAKIKEVGDGS